MSDAILASFGVSPADWLGSGGESDVYALDAGRVLRLYKGENLDYLVKRQAFYAELRRYDLPFATPEFLEVDSRSGMIYAVERRMPGRDFAQVLPTLEGIDRERALSSYLEVAGQIGAVRLPGRPFGEIITPDVPIQVDDWGAYLSARMAQTLASSRADLEADVPRLADVLDVVDRTLSPLAAWQEPCLVHGDYFPGNVFIDDDLRICGVGDFGYSTVVGDPRLDIAAAIAFLEVVRGYREEDSVWIRRTAARWWDGSILAVVDAYRLYYSIYFSGCKRDDPDTYGWCAANLQAVAARLD